MAVRSKGQQAKASNRPDKSVEEIILSLPKGEQIIMNRLRSLILECLPKAKESVKYGVPFYSRHRIICFIWPPSIFSGPNRTLETQQAKGVALGFWQGNRMANEGGALKAEGKQVCAMYFKSIKDVDERQIEALLFEADLVDGSFRSRKAT